MTGGIYSLSDEELGVLDPALNPVVSGAVIENKGLSDLVFECVMVYSSDDDYSLYKLAVSILKAMDKSSGIPSICRQILLAAIFLMRTSSSRAIPKLYWKPLISAVITRSCLNARHLYATVVLTGAIIAAV